MRRLVDALSVPLSIVLYTLLVFWGTVLLLERKQARPAAFVAEGNDVALIAITDEGTRVYRVFGPKMLYATVVVVGPDGRASIRQ